MQEFLFMSATEPTVCQRMAMWKWRQGREKALREEHNTMAGVTVQV
jgi:hypothetical protein